MNMLIATLFFAAATVIPRPTAPACNDPETIETLHALEDAVSLGREENAHIATELVSLAVDMATNPSPNKAARKLRLKKRQRELREIMPAIEQQAKKLRRVVNACKV